MKILAFDSSAKSASVAILDGEKIIAESFENEGRTHSKTLLAMFEKIVNEHKINVKDVDLIAVTNGPGSYTGVRIGVSVAQGLALAWSVKCVGVSSLEALAQNIDNTDKSLICAVMDARADQVYTALFKRENSKIIRVSNDACMKISELVEKFRKTNENYVLVGDASEKVAEIFNENNITCQINNDIYGKASSVARIAQNKEHYDVVKLKPVYLKLTQAEMER